MVYGYSKRQQYTSCESVLGLKHMYRNININSGSFPISELILGCVHACEKVVQHSCRLGSRCLAPGK